MGILRHIMRDVVKPVLVDVGDRFWTNPWRSISPIKLRVEYTDTQFEFKFKAPSTSTLNIYDGDGTMTEVAGNNNTLVTHTTSYAAPGTYYLYVEGDYLDLTYFSVRTDGVSGDPVVTFDVSKFSVLTDLTGLSISNCNPYGNIESLVALTSLTQLYFNNAALISGDVSKLVGIDMSVAMVGCDLTTFDSVTVLPASSRITRFKNKGWTSEMWDNAIKTYQNRNYFNIVLVGANPRTSDSDAALINLINTNNAYTGTGVIVSVSETDPVGILGSELYTPEDALSIGSEADNTSGWTGTDLGGDNEFVSQSLITSGSNFAFKMNLNATPTANANITLTTPIVVTEDDVHRISVDLRHVGEGDVWGMWVHGANTENYNFNGEDVFIKSSTYLRSPNTSLDVKFAETNPSNTGGLYVDNLSIKKVTLPE
jgi:hypothetical protein